MLRETSTMDHNFLKNRSTGGCAEARRLAETCLCHCVDWKQQINLAELSVEIGHEDIDTTKV